MFITYIRVYLLYCCVINYYYNDMISDTIGYDSTIVCCGEEVNSDALAGPDALCINRG